MRNKWLIGTGIAVLSVLFSASIAYAALTFTATAVTSDGALTLTTGAASTAVTVTYGISANAATTTDSLYVGGLAQHTGATASATALVIGTDVSLYRSAANFLTIGQAGLGIPTATASGTGLVLGNDVTLFRSAANNLKIQGNLANATTTDSLYVGGLLQHTGGTASATALVIGADVPLFRNAANTLRLQGKLSLSDNILSATTTDSLSVGGRALLNSYTSVATTSATTTRSLLVGAAAGTATTTLSFGNVSGSTGSCIEMHREGTSYRMFLTASSGMQTVAGVGLKVEAGSCRD